MKLWRIEYEAPVIYVVTDDGVDEDDAIVLADNHVIEAMHYNSPESVYVGEVRTTTTIDRKWLDSIPWGDNPDDLTCGEIAGRIEAANAEREARKPLPGQMEMPMTEGSPDDR